ncbi:MAG: hypothetical protein AMXMBFR13_07830 [Phycisphaerae bacterium]
MTNSSSLGVDLIERARAGDRPSLEGLGAAVRERVYPYVRRVLLDHERSEDVVQDISLIVWQSLDTLKNTERFWPWVFTIATNRIREHLRRESRRKTFSLSDMEEDYLQVPRASVADPSDGMAQASRAELAERALEAMSKLRERQRMVLALRFYENMSHRQIAGVLGCTELNARVSFFQAKRALLARLKRMGVDKTALGAALVAFGHVTLAPEASAAVVTVSAAALREGMAAGLLTLKAKLTAGLAAALLMVAWTVWWPGDSASQVAAPPRPVGIHFVIQSLSAQSAPLTFSQTRSQGAYEQWYQFPEGVGGPFLFRMQRWDPTRQNKLCWWIEDGSANYYIHSGQRIAYVNDAHLTSGSLSTRVLPTDSDALSGFIREMEGETSGAMVDGPGLVYQRDPQTGYVARRMDRRFEYLGPWETIYEYADQDPALFTAPTGLPIQDDRDAMHQRGWTFFRVEGHLGKKELTGRGRLPFTYVASKTHPAWLELKLDGQVVAVDDGRGARLGVNSADDTSRLTGHSLFLGLSRPWTGFHTIDTIRRDAAVERIPYETRSAEPDRSAEVVLKPRRDGDELTIHYMIDLEADLVQHIRMWQARGDGPEQYLGLVRFSYLQDVSAVSEEFAPPAVVGPDSEPASASVGVLWLSRIAARPPPSSQLP